MAGLQERIQIVKDTAEEKSQLQMKCFDQFDLEKIKSNIDLGRARYAYENCIKDNFRSFPNLVRRDKLLTYGKI